MNELNVSFASLASGNFDFLTRYPLVVDPKTFVWTKGDKEVLNPMMGTVQPHRVQVDDMLRKTGNYDPGKSKFIQNKNAPVYADFIFNTDSPASKMRVSPSLHLMNYGGHCVKLYYLPWKEDTMHSMVIDDQADFFMTASMHGCRFAVKDFGNGQLNVSHANVQPGPGIDAQAKVLDMIRGDNSLAPTALSFGKDKYFADAQRLIHRTRRGLMPIGIRPDDVKTAHVDTYLANVVGVRSGSSWNFYYQLTCQVDVALHGKSTKPRYLGLFGRKTVDVVQNLKLDVVLKVAKIYPAEETVYSL